MPQNGGQVEAATVVLYGLEIVVPLMTAELLKVVLTLSCMALWLSLVCLSLVPLPGTNSLCLSVKHPPRARSNRTLKHIFSHVCRSVLSPDCFRSSTSVRHVVCVLCCKGPQMTASETHFELFCQDSAPYKFLNYYYYYRVMGWV